MVDLHHTFFYSKKSAAEEKREDFVFNLEVDNKILMKRVLSRVSCLKCGAIFNEISNPPSKNHLCDPIYLQKRKDDNEATLIKRLKTHFVEIPSMLDFYQSKDLLTKINATNDVTKIYEEITAFINP